MLKPFAIRYRALDSNWISRAGEATKAEGLKRAVIWAETEECAIKDLGVQLYGDVAEMERVEDTGDCATYKIWLTADKPFYRVIIF